eukprot:356120-Chlamydomonas_euryale.AAC.18
MVQPTDNRPSKLPDRRGHASHPRSSGGPAVTLVSSPAAEPFCKRHAPALETTLPKRLWKSTA